MQIIGDTHRDTSQGNSVFRLEFSNIQSFLSKDLLAHTVFKTKAILGN